jgi:small subunit ribosomal protein S1
MEGQILSVDENMNVNVSFARVQRDLAWQRVTQLANFDVSVDATILKLGDQGTTLDIEGLPAFMPWSHWSVSDEERDWRLQGTKLRVKFLQVDRAQRRLVVSRRRELLDSMMEELEPGAIVEGTVKTIKSFGAVVTLGSGLEGLLHVSQISQEFVQDVSKVLAEGDAVRCVLLSVDSEDASVKLSTKMLETKPGEMLQDAAAVYQRAGAAAAGKPADGDAATEAAE